MTEERAALAVQRRLMAALVAAARCDDPHAELVETHISWVLLRGGEALKIKKAMNLGFLDFSTLALRRHFCAEELRLNRRLAPELYLEVVAIGGSPEAPQLGGGGEALEYAVRMRRFDQSGLLDRLAAAGTLTREHLDALALAVARFHAAADHAAADSPYGRPAAVAAPVTENFTVLRQRAAAPAAALIERLSDWSRDEGQRLAEVFSRRRAQGLVRECHGDLHLGNVAWVDGRLVIFDCIEFDPNLRWIDVANETAFTAMDLAARGRDDFAARFLNAYLEASGDYASLAVQPYYQAYRAVVRAKVAAIRASQPGQEGAARRVAEADCVGHLELAQRLAAPGQPALVITHGLAGSGKSTVAAWLVEGLAAVRLRSDVERKRLHGLVADARSEAAVDGGIYGAVATRRTYDRLRRLADTVLAAGRPVVVDATFLDAEQRQSFRLLARERGVSFVIVALRAPENLLRARLAQRVGDASEATPAVLEAQLARVMPLDSGELAQTVTVDSARAEAADVVARVRARLAARGLASARPA